MSEASDRHHYESHTWDDEECIVCGVSWTDCSDVCPESHDTGQPQNQHLTNPGDHLLPKIAAWLLGAAAIGLVIGVWRALDLPAQTLIDLTIVGWLTWMSWDRIELLTRADKATDDADLALGKTLAIEDHLSGIEPASTGRHGRG